MDIQRSKVIEIARSWLGTPYKHRGQIKGVGVDCATLISNTYAEAGLIAPVDLPQYSPQWHLNKDSQRYLGIITDHATEIFNDPGPGDVVLWQFGRAFSHGAIVVAWPGIIHALVNVGCTEDDAEASAMLASLNSGEDRPRRFFSYWV